VGRELSAYTNYLCSRLWRYSCIKSLRWIFC